MKILITGATGFVGSQLIRHWAKDHQIRALVRSTSKFDELKNFPSEFCSGDVTDPASLRKAVQGVEAVIHLASLVGESGKREDFFKVNLEGTRNLLEACRGLPLKRFIYISSLSVITGYREHDGTKEDAPYLPTGENYADSKIEAEKLVMEYYQKYGIPVTVLRPGFIFGPGDKVFLSTVIDNLRQGKVILIDHGKKLLNLTYIENLIEAIGLALHQPEVVGEIFNITDGEKITKQRFFFAIADQLNLPRPAKSIPFSLAKIICETSTAIHKILGIKKPPLLSRMKLRFAGQNQWFDISKAEKKLNYKHQKHFDESIQEALKWYINI